MKSTAGELTRRKKTLKHTLLFLILILFLICLYNGSTFAPALPRSEEVIAIDDGTDPVTGKFVRKRDYFDQLFDDDDNDNDRDNELPKSLPVCLFVTDLLLKFVLSLLHL